MKTITPKERLDRLISGYDQDWAGGFPSVYETMDTLNVVQSYIAELEAEISRLKESKQTLLEKPYEHGH